MSYTLWCGSEESYQAVLTARESLVKFLSAYSGDMPDTPPAWKKDGALAVVPIAGSLISGNAGWLSMFGVSGYADIGAALVAAASDPEVQSILLDVASPGGDCSAELGELADLVAQIASVKQVSAHIDSVGASAAYWIACGATKSSISAMGQAGSIGAVMTHASRSRMNAENGIDVTIIRSGDYKMIGGTNEPLSDLARAEYQSKVNDMEAIFLAHVAEQKGMTASDVSSQMGGGRMFLGKRAVAAGLVDKVQSHADAMASAKKIDKARTMPNNRNK